MLVEPRPYATHESANRPGVGGVRSAASTVAPNVGAGFDRVIPNGGALWSDRLAAMLQRGVGDRPIAAGMTARHGSVPSLQRMTVLVGNAHVMTLAQLNAALNGLVGLDRTMPPAPGALPGAAPGLYPAALVPGTFAGAAPAAAVDTAIAQSSLSLYDYMTVQEIVDDVNAILAAPVAAPAPLPPAAVAFDNHGYKHFGGGGPNRVAQGGDQWSLGIVPAQAIMVSEIHRIEAHLRAHNNPNANGVTLYYHTTNHTANVGKSEGRNTRKYTIQIDYNVGANTVQYHGYPDKAAVAVGLGYSKNNKLWNV